MKHETLFVEASVLARPRLGGIAHAVDGLLRAFLADEAMRDQYDLRLVLPRIRRSSLPEPVHHGAAATRLPLPLRGYHRWAALRAMPPVDVVLGSGVYLFPNFANWPLRRSTSMTMVHDLVFMRHPETVDAGTRSWLAANIRRWIARTDVVITGAEHVRREIEETLHPPVPVRVVPWGIDVTRFAPQPEPVVASVLQRYALPRDYILHVGNFEPRKNLVRLVGAYRSLDPELRRRHPLVLAGGGGWNRSEIDAAVAAARDAGASVVEPCTYVRDADLPALYTGATLLAHPSLYEGFGLSVLQAMACGTPVVAGTGSALDEIGGDAVLRCNVLDEADIAARITELLGSNTLRAQLAEAGRRRAAHYTWQDSVQRFREVLDAL